MLKSFSVSIGDKFESKYPIRTGPGYREDVKGEVSEIYLPAGKIEIRGQNPNDIWVIEIDQYLTKNIHLVRVDD